MSKADLWDILPEITDEIDLAEASLAATPTEEPSGSEK